MLADKRLETFNPHRTLEAFTWSYDGKTYDDRVSMRRDLAAAHAAAQSYAAAPQGWLYLFGANGAGKSHLAAGIANAAADRGMRVSYASVPALLDYVRDGYSDHTATARLEALQSVPLLVLDDIGVEAEKRDTTELLFRLLNHRSRERADLPTVLTSNAHPDDFDPRFADRIYGQTDAGARIVWLVVSSYRRLRDGR